MRNLESIIINIHIYTINETIYNYKSYFSFTIIAVIA